MKTLQNYPTHRGNFRLSTLIAELQIPTQTSVQQKQNYGYPLRASGRNCAATLSAPNHMRLPGAKVGVIVMMLCLLASTLNAQWGQTTYGVTKCASPRFLVSKGEENAFSLRSTDVTVNVVGVIADVNVRQIYVNKGATPVEATYIFPASTRAAVYGLTMTIGPRIVKAVIKEKEKARAEYIAAIQQGRTATLLDQITPNIFQMQVGNIPAHDSVVVDMHYTEAIELREGEYEFVYPGVVGPRYVSGVKPSEYDAVLNGFDMPQQIPGTFSIKTHIMAGVPITGITSPTHKLSIQTLDAISRKTLSASAKNSVTSISIAEETTLNRDYVVQYRLTGRAIESGLLLYKGEKENFFMLMVQPPKNVEIPNIVPREFVFIVDVSGSMQGQPTIVARDLMNNLFKTLRPTDKFNIMMFSGGAQVLGENSVEATPDNIKRAYNFLTNGYGGGGTELLPALKQALAMKAEPGYARSFIAVTDGYVTVEREAFDLVRNNLNNANFYAFGIGGNVNRWLLEGLARAGNAESFIVTNINEAPAMAERFRQYIEAPVLTGVKVDWGNMNVYDVDPGSIPSATAKRPIVVYGKWKGNATGTLRLTGNAADGAYTFDVNIAAQPQLPEHAALQYLWARNRIKFIEDGMVSSWGYERAAQPDEQQLITSIGLQYNLLTKYTSFIAVDSTMPVKKDTAQTAKEKRMQGVADEFKKRHKEITFDNSKLIEKVTQLTKDNPAVTDDTVLKQLEEELNKQASKTKVNLPDSLRGIGYAGLDTLKGNYWSNRKDSKRNKKAGTGNSKGIINTDDEPEIIENKGWEFKNGKTSYPYTSTSDSVGTNINRDSQSGLATYSVTSNGNIRSYKWTNGKVPKITGNTKKFAYLGSYDGVTKTDEGKAQSSVPTKKQVTVTAKRDEVDAKDVGKVRSVSAEPLTTTHARDSVVSVATTRSGVQASGGGLVVRGSRNTDNKYLVDGQDVTDVITGTLGVAADKAGTQYAPSAATNATEDVQVVTRNANAQYGNALGGVVNTTIKTTGNTNQAKDANLKPAGSTRLDSGWNVDAESGLSHWLKADTIGTTLVSGTATSTIPNTNKTTNQTGTEVLRWDNTAGRWVRNTNVSETAAGNVTTQKATRNSSAKTQHSSTENANKQASNSSGEVRKTNTPRESPVSINSTQTEQLLNAQSTTPSPTTKAVIPEGKQTTTATQPQTVTLQRRVAQESTQSAPKTVQSAVAVTAVSSDDAEAADPLVPSVAPPRVYVGPVIGYMMPQNYTNTFDMLNGTTQQVSGTGNGYIGGLSAEFLMGDPKNSKSSLIITTLYHSTPATFTTNGTVAAFKANSPDTTSVLAQFLAERNVSRLTLGIMYKLNLGNTPFVVMAGVNPSLILSNTSETKATLPSGTAWAANSTTPERMLTTGKIANANTFHLGAQIGIGYEFILKKIIVVPSIMYNLGLTNATSNATNKLSSVDFVLSIRFAL